ncbi:hypothetical protein Tco_0353324 [Tanacetum coccineum]
MSDPKFADTHNLVAFLEKPIESEGFEEIVDFLNANPIKYALTINPTIYCSCVKQFWDTIKAKTVTGEVQLQALVDKKKVIITESTIRRDLQLEDANGVDCLPNVAISKQLTLIGIYVTPSHTKKIFGNMKREGKGFSGRVTSLFQTMMVQAHKEMGKGSEIPIDPHHTPIITQLSSSQPQRKQKSKKFKKKNNKVPQPSGSTNNVPDGNVPTTSNDPLLSSEDRLKLTELIDLCTNLQKKVLDLEKSKIAQDSEIASLKKKVKKLERRNKSRTPRLKRLRKVGSARRVESSSEASLGDQEDASKQGRKIADIDADAEVTLIDETQGRNDDNLMFDTSELEEEERLTRQKEEEANIALIESWDNTQAMMDADYQMAEQLQPSEFTTTTTITTPAASKPSQDKGKAKVIESEKPLKKKDQIMYDQEVALNLQAQLQAKLEEEERLTRQREEGANIALIESWDNTQSMMDDDYQMAQQLQVKEQEQLSIKEKSKLFVQLLKARKKHFAKMREKEKRNKPPNQAQQRKLYCNYLKNMEGYTLKYTKRAGDKLEQERTKKQKVDDDKEREDLQQCFELVTEEDDAIDVIQLATKPSPVVNF